ncbi:MAG: crotonase/enoyl-CoA hydratase family protein [Pseudomonadota bacterium]
MTDRIRLTVENHVADVRLIRTDKMNALDNEMMKAIVETIQTIDNDPNVRCVVVSGDGRAFCAGLDMSNFQRMSKGGDRAAGAGVTRDKLAVRTHGIVNFPQQCVWGWRQLRVPVISAAHGVALGGGFQLMLGADIRIVHPDTKLAILESRWGLVPDMSATAIMRLCAREDIVRELTYTGRFFSGEEAKEYGFATHVSADPRAHAMELAAAIAERSPDAVQMSKALFNGLPDRTEAEQLLAESEAQDGVIGQPNQVEAVKAALEKRAANFIDGAIPHSSAAE